MTVTYIPTELSHQTVTVVTCRPSSGERPTEADLVVIEHVPVRFWREALRARGFCFWLSYRLWKAWWRAGSRGRRPLSSILGRAHKLVHGISMRLMARKRVRQPWETWEYARPVMEIDWAGGAPWVKDFVGPWGEDLMVLIPENFGCDRDSITWAPDIMVAKAACLGKYHARWEAQVVGSKS